MRNCHGGERKKGEDTECGEEDRSTIHMNTA
jgi:hypothetical protein